MGCILGWFLEIFWEVFWKPWTLENHTKVYNYMHFQGLDPFGAESVSGSASGRGLGCVLQDFGSDWGTHWDSNLQLLAAFPGSDFGVWMAKKAKQVPEMQGPAAGAGPV